jgi:biotin carboxyl carrier protein
MYQVVFNGKDKVDVKQDKNIIIVDGREIDWDLHQVNAHTFHLIYNNRSYTLEISEEEGKRYDIKLNGKSISIELKDKLDLLLEKLGLDVGDAGKLQSIKAPMPGLIVEVKVNPGDQVKKGDQLLILEAMKMENIIKSPGEGTVKAVNVVKGDGVEKNQVMIQF